MFKAALIGFALFLGAQTLYIQHNDAIDTNDLSNVQTQADQFMRSVVPSIEKATLSKGDQNGDVFKYQYLNNNAPLTITQVQAQRVSDDEDAKDIDFKLLETINLVQGPLYGGKLTIKKRAYGIQSFAKAVQNLDWD